MIVGYRKLSVASHAESRQSSRVEIGTSIRVRQRGARSIQVIVEELSCGGCRVQWPHSISVGDRLWVTLPGLAPISALVVWAADFKFGCRFEVPLHAAVLRLTIARTQP